jgi:hypothetical protein
LINVITAAEAAEKCGNKKKIEECLGIIYRNIKKACSTQQSYIEVSTYLSKKSINTLWSILEDNDYLVELVERDTGTSINHRIKFRISW